MKHLILSLVLLLGASTVAKEKVMPPNWQPIYEIKNSNMKGYYDANSFIDIDETTRAGILMIVFNTPQKINIGDREIVVRSYVKSFLVECKKQISAPLNDLYFIDRFPTLTSKPLAAFEYNPGVGIQPVPPGSIMHGLFCGPRV